MSPIYRFHPQITFPFTPNIMKMFSNSNTSGTNPHLSASFHLEIAQKSRRILILASLQDKPKCFMFFHSKNLKQSSYTFPASFPCQENGEKYLIQLVVFYTTTDAITFFTNRGLIRPTELPRMRRSTYYLISMPQAFTEGSLSHTH